MRYLITGGFGFIGYQLAKRLLDNGHQVIVIDNMSAGAESDELKFYTQYTYLPGDLALINAFPVVDGVFHLAAIIGTKDIRNNPNYMITKTVDMMKNIIENYANSGIKVVYTSTQEVVTGQPQIYNHLYNTEDAVVGWQEPFNTRWSYSQSKFIGELMLRNSDCRYSITRFTNVYGTRMVQDYVIKAFIRRALAKEDPFIVHSPYDTRSFVYVDDVVDALIRIMESENTDGEIINIGGNEEVEINELARMITSLAGYKPTIKLKEGTQVERRTAVCEKARRLIKWEPTTFFKEGLEQTFEWYRKEGYGKDNR